jgi:uncharacterized membrane protein
MKRFHLNLRQLNQVQVAWLLLFLAMVVYTIVMGYESVLRYDTFKATAFDLGNMDQAVWNTLHGRFLVWTNQGDNYFGPPTRLAQHVEPIFFLLSLLYVFHSDPRILLIFQTLALASGALPVFLLTRKHLPEWPLLAAVMTFAYLILPALLGVNIFDFHPVALATPLLLYAILAITYKHYFWFVLACLLAAATKEEIPTVVALLGFLVIWKYKIPRIGTILFICGILWTLIAMAFIEPHFYTGTQHNTFWYRYEALGSSPSAAIVNILFHPWILITTFVTFDRIYYLLNIFRGIGFLAIFAPEWLLPTLPNFALNLLSNDKLLYTGIYQYNAPIIPFVMMSSIIGLQRVMKLWARWRGEVPVLPSDSVTRGEIQKKPGYISLSDRVVLAYHSTVQALSTQPVVTRSLALAQPGFSVVAYEGRTQWKRFGERMEPIVKSVPLIKFQWVACVWIIAMALLNFAFMAPTVDNLMATSVPGVREAHIQQLLAEIPPNASVSASTSLNPHLTERQYITIFPNVTISSIPGSDQTVEYVIVDMSTVFPEDKIGTVKALDQLSQGRFCTLKMSDDVILLGRRDVVKCP